MDFSICMILAAFLTITYANATDKASPQVTEDLKKEAEKTSLKPQKREQRYEMREVILYLTPTQIKNIESGKSVIEAQAGPQSQLPKDKPQPNEDIQNVANEVGQQIQREYENFEEDRKQKLQSENTVQDQEAVDVNHQPPSQTDRPQLSADPQRYPEFTSQLQFIPVEHLAQHDRPQLSINPQRYGEISPHLQLIPFEGPTPNDRPHLSINSQRYAELTPQVQVIPNEDPRLVHIPTQEQHRPQWRPDNYAYFYLYPNGEPPKNIQSSLFYNDAKGVDPQQSFLSHQESNSYLKPKFHLVPYEYGTSNVLEHRQQQTPQFQSQFEAEDSGNFKIYETQQFKAQQLKHNNLEIHQLEAQEVAVRPEEVANFKASLEGQSLGAQKEEEVYKEIAGLQQLRVHKEQAQQLETQNLGFQKQEAERENAKLDAQIKKAQELRAQLEAQEKEAQKLDEHLEAQQLEVERLKVEQAEQQQQHLNFLGEIVQNKGQFNSLLTPLLQHQNIEDSFSKSENKPQINKPQLEGGFLPLQYAPKYNSEKYNKEVEKILRESYLEKQNAIAKAQAIAEEPPVAVHKEVQITKHYPVHIIKHVKVPVPTPFYVPVPHPIEVKVPQPYPVPLEIIRPIPIPIVKTEKVEVEKPVPYEVEKHVPVPITKNVYIPVDKPYFVERIVPVEKTKKIRVPKPQKFSIIRHVWEH